MDKQRSAIVAAVGVGVLVAAIAVRKLWTLKEQREFQEHREEARDRLMSVATTHDIDRNPPKKRAYKPPKKIDAV